MSPDVRRTSPNETEEYFTKFTSTPKVHLKRKSSKPIIKKRNIKKLDAVDLLSEWEQKFSKQKQADVPNIPKPPKKNFYNTQQVEWVKKVDGFEPNWDEEEESTTKHTVKQAEVRKLNKAVISNNKENKYKGPQYDYKDALIFTKNNRKDPKLLKFPIESSSIISDFDYNWDE